MTHDVEIILLIIMKKNMDCKSIQFIQRKIKSLYSVAIFVLLLLKKITKIPKKSHNSNE